jgi:2-oxoglutarate dehydrogenase E2 component (dihydrolipoamide succinyltransferase)
MSLEMKVPAVGESITEVTIGQWFKKDGDQVQMDEVLCELESDKATFELTAESAGTLRIKAQAGETLEIGATICVIENGATASEAKTEVKAAPAPAAKAKTGEVKEMIVPTVGESITEVTLATWLKADGDFVQLDDIIAEVDSDKATFELPAEATGILRHVAKEGDTLEIGGLICRIEVVEGGKPTAEAAATPVPNRCACTLERKLRDRTCFARSR